MKQNELLDDLGRLARTQAEQSAASDAEADELLRPLDAAAHDRIVARLLPLVRPDARPDVQSDAPPGQATAPGADAPRPNPLTATPGNTADAPRAQALTATPGNTADATPGKTRGDTPGHARITGADRGHRSAQAAPHRSRPRRWMMAVAPALAAAAVLLFFVWPQAGAPLPSYALELSGGRAAERGAAADAIIRVGPGDRVSAVLRPATAISGEVAVRVFVNGQALPDAPERVVEQSADGALRISGLGPALAALAPGRHRLQLAVGRPGHLPDALPEALTGALPPSGAVAEGVQLLSYEVERLPP